MSSSSSSVTDFEEDSEEEEPQLKYDRLGNDMLKILSRDAASCVVVHFKFVAVGTHWGQVFIMDHNGNICKKFSAHSTQVTGVCLDENGDYLASCSDDGRVVVQGLYSNDNDLTINVDKPVKSVALDPQFSKNSSKCLVYGVDGLVLYEKGAWLSPSKSTVLHTGEGLVRTIKWRGELVAWANDWGVKMYDMKQQRRITHIPRAPNNRLRPEIYPAHIVWKNDITLLIGWANEIKVCVVRERKFKNVAWKPDKFVEIVYQIPVSYACCGIAPFGDQLVVLAYELSSEESEAESSSKVRHPVSERPQLCIWEHDPAACRYDEISSDALSIIGYQTYRCNDYSLTAEMSEGMLYIVSPKDIVVARRRDEDDHVSWLLQCEKYEEALTAVQQFGKQLKQHSFVEVGMAYISHLIEVKEFDDAAKACVRVLGNDVILWEEMVEKFSEANQLYTLSPYLPSGDVRLPQESYHKVMKEILHKDRQAFSKLLKEWPNDIYNIGYVIHAVREEIDHDDDEILLASLARLFAMDQRYDKALSIYLKLRHSDTFNLIRKHNLHAALRQNIFLLIDFGKEEAVSLLLDNMHYIPIETVVKELDHKHKGYLHMYLHSLFLRDPDLGSEYHSLQLRLYAEFDRTKLLPFLKSSHYYSLEKALKVCEERDYVDETVFLLARMGNASKALKLIIDNDADVFRAIKFCKEQNDTDLWRILIDNSLSKPEFIRDLLENIGTHVYPVILIQRIPTGLRIPGLRDAIVKILQDYSMQTSMWFQCKNILSSDVIKLNKKQHRLHTRPVRVDGDSVCDACGKQLVISEGSAVDPPKLRLFWCQHLFHDECLQSLTACSICTGRVPIQK